MLAEPLGVAMHAVARAGDMAGRHVLVSGCGPVGLLAVLAVGSDEARGSAEGMDPAISVAFEAAAGHGSSKVVLTFV